MHTDTYDDMDMYMDWNIDVRCALTLQGPKPGLPGRAPSPTPSIPIPLPSSRPGPM